MQVKSLYLILCRGNRLFLFLYSERIQLRSTT